MPAALLDPLGHLLGQLAGGVVLREPEGRDGGRGTASARRGPEPPPDRTRSLGPKSRGRSQPPTAQPNPAQPPPRPALTRGPEPSQPTGSAATARKCLYRPEVSASPLCHVATAAAEAQSPPARASRARGRGGKSACRRIALCCRGARRSGERFVV